MFGIQPEKVVQEGFHTNRQTSTAAGMPLLASGSFSRFQQFPQLLSQRGRLVEEPCAVVFRTHSLRLYFEPNG